MEFKNKILQYTLTTNDADAFLLVSDTNRFWISNFLSSYGFVIALKGELKVKIFLDKRYYQNAVDFLDPNLFDVICLNAKTQIIDTLKKYHVKTLMVEQEYFSFNDYVYIKDYVKKLINFPSDVFRIQKTTYELECMQKAADITCETLNWIQKKNLIGLSEHEVANVITFKMLKLGATKNSFDLIVASGKNGAYPHHKPSGKLIMNDEFVTVDIGCVYKGYCSDITRTFPIGNPPQKLIEAYKTVYESNKKGIESVSYKKHGNEVDQVCRDVIDATEFKEYFIHSTGHGVGINVHELPNVSANYHKPLENNSVVTIEPGIYLPNLGGIRIEDMVLVKKDKIILMSENANKWIF